jgi:hypothetical protein
MNKKYIRYCKICNKEMSFSRYKKIRKTCSLKCLKILQCQLTSGINNGNFNNHEPLSKEHKRKIKESCQNINQGKNNGMFGIPSPMTGKHHTEENKQKMKKNSPDRSGENNNMWQGGIAYNPYSIEFSNKLREQIRKRDGFTCQKCHTHQKDLDRELSVHHIDYNKLNYKEENLISLCCSCHMKTNGNRDYWFAYFTYKIKEVVYENIRN